MKRTFEYYNADIARDTFCSYIRPSFEYAVFVWNLRLRYEIDVLESVQRRAIKVVPYELRLEKVRIMDLEKGAILLKYLN